MSERYARTRVCHAVYAILYAAYRCFERDHVRADEVIAK